MNINGKELTDAEVDARLGRQYRKLLALHEQGKTDHPYNIACGDWAQTLADARLGNHDTQPTGDNPPEFPGKPANPQRAADVALQGVRNLHKMIPGYDRLARNQYRGIPGLRDNVELCADGITVKSR